MIGADAMGIDLSAIEMSGADAMGVDLPVVHRFTKADKR
jgi:hypothetical protein